MTVDESWLLSADLANGRLRFVEHGFAKDEAQCEWWRRRENPIAAYSSTPLSAEGSAQTKFPAHEWGHWSLGRHYCPVPAKAMQGAWTTRFHFVVVALTTLVVPA